MSCEFMSCELMSCELLSCELMSWNPGVPSSEGQACWSGGFSTTNIW